MGVNVRMEAVQNKTPVSPGGLRLTEEALEDYLEALTQCDRVVGTLEAYRHSIFSLYRTLPEDKLIHGDTLVQWQAAMVEQGYSPRTINARLSAVNGLMSFLGRRDLQLPVPLNVEPEEQPELTRAEYLRLLSTARTLGKERLYLLVKVFGSTGLPLRELPSLTREAVWADQVLLPGQGRLHIPQGLRLELLSFGDREGIAAGPLFRGRSGAPIRRTTVTESMKQLCRDAGVPQEKANPRCLRRLWQSTQSAIRARVDLLVEQTFDQLWETEQLEVGWTAAAKEVSEM